MNAEEYIAERVDGQVRWYSSRSQQAQLRFKWLRAFEITAAATIPLLAGFAPDGVPVDLVVAVLGALIALASALLSLNQYQENWIEYRTTAESLKHEKFLFLTGSDPYRGADAFSLFVNRIESLISKENSAWSQNAQVTADRTGSG